MICFFATRINACLFVLLGLQYGLKRFVLFVLLGDYSMDNGESLGLKLGCVVLLGLSHDFNRILHVQCFRRWLLEVVCKT